MNYSRQPRRLSREELQARHDRAQVDSARLASAALVVFFLGCCFPGPLAGSRKVLLTPARLARALAQASPHEVSQPAPFVHLRLGSQRPPR